MTRDQHLEFCNRCKNRKFDPTQGLVCSITDRIADFENTCENFDVDETVKIEKRDRYEVPNYEVVTELSESSKALLRTQQDVLYAIIGGAAAAIVCALLWAFVTVTTKYQIGYMAIGVGLLVGFAVRYYGAGIDKHFGFIGAFFALLGCALGNLLSQVGFIAESESLGYFETITLLSPEIILSLYKESFSPMDVLFYGIAGYEGFKFAFRTISPELIQNVEAGKLDPPPYANLRLPTVVVLFLILSVGGFIISRASLGVKTFYYESGGKRSMGELINGKENGAWEGWWENSKPQYKGYYSEGKQDSSWQFFNEEGNLSRTLSFKRDLMHGHCTDYYADGQKSGEGQYVNNRLTGLWTYYYPDGKINQKGVYKLDLPDGAWETYYANGTMATKGMYKNGLPFGDWTTWNDSGIMIQQLHYVEGEQKMMNTWSQKGKPEVVNGNGVFTSHFESGNVMNTISIQNGKKTGMFKKYYEDGKLQEEGEYRDGTYYLLNGWTMDGVPTVVKGDGKYENVSEDDPTLFLSGFIMKGLKSGTWTMKSVTEDFTMQELSYVDGKLDGLNTSYFKGGQVNAEGNFRKDKYHGKWTWYFENGEIESTVTFIDGKKDGEQYFYKEGGDLLRTEVYKDGEFVETKLPE